MVSQSPTNGTLTTGKALVGGPFSLVDASGKRVTEKDFAGRKMLVFFGFTSCPDVCPGGLQVIAAALQKLGAKADKIAPVFITLDAERDPPAKVAEYAKSFSPKLIGLSGTAEEVNAAAKAYRVYFKKVPGSDPANYNIDHSSIIYLMDEAGQYITHYPYPITVDELAAKLEQAL
jgi:protein SCO1/2